MKSSVQGKVGQLTGMRRTGGQQGTAQRGEEGTILGGSGGYTTGGPGGPGKGDQGNMLQGVRRVHHWSIRGALYREVRRAWYSWGQEGTLQWARRVHHWRGSRGYMSVGGRSGRHTTGEGGSEGYTT